MRIIAWPALFVICWSSGFVATGLLAENIPPAGLLAWRYLLTAALLIGAVAVLRRPRIGRGALGQQAVLGLLGHVVFLGGVFGGAALGVGAGTSALVCALQPMLVVVAGRLLWRDRVRWVQVLGLLVGLLAVLLAVGGTGGSAGLAVLLPVASLLGLSAHAVLERRWAPEVDLLTALATQVSTAAVVFCVVAIASGTFLLPVDTSVGTALAWLVVLSGLGGYGAYTVCLRCLGASRTSVLLYLTPPVTTLWAWAMFGQEPSMWQIVALCLGAVGVALALHEVRSRPEHVADPAHRPAPPDLSPRTSPHRR